MPTPEKFLEWVTNQAMTLTNAVNSVFGASGANHTIGLVPDPGSSAGTTRFLREDATWDNSSWSTYTPIVTAGSGTFTTVSATGRFKQIGKTVFYNIVVTITTNGTAGGSVIATLPVGTAVSISPAIGSESNSGKSIIGHIGASSNHVGCTYYDVTYPGADGNVITVNGIYEVP